VPLTYLLDENLRGRLWKYLPAPSGSRAVVWDKEGKLLAMGIYDPTGPLAVRVCAVDGQRLDDDLILAKFEAALALRRVLFDGRTDGRSGFGLARPGGVSISAGPIEFAEQGQPAPGIPARGADLKSRFGIKLSQGHAGPFIDKFVEADALALGESPQAVML
jgi:hypothetical protein